MTMSRTYSTLVPRCRNTSLRPRMVPSVRSSGGCAMASLGIAFVGEG